jgi:hypothetical protein
MIEAHRRMVKLAAPMEAETLPETEAENSDQEDDVMELLLRKHDCGSKQTPQKQDSTMLTAITELQHHKRLIHTLKKKTDIFQFWHNHTNADLSALCLTVLSLPMTQVSVERIFSGLKYILNDQRFRMKKDIIDAIMVLRTSHQ